MLDQNMKKLVLNAQKNEITEYYIYKKLSKSTKDSHNQNILNQIAEDELEHYTFWKQYTQREVKPSKLKKWFYYLISRIFGLTFGIRLMELGEGQAQIFYSTIRKVIPKAQTVIDDEETHEKQLISLIDEELLDYIGSVVLGLNDALVELTGALAGLTLAFQNTQLIALAGLITGIAASLSMAASEYLATKSEEKSSKNPLKAAIYTGFAYIFTVIFLILPYLILSNQSPLVCLTITLINAILIVFVFTFYISVAKDLSFQKRFTEIVGISLGIAALSFIIGLFVRSFFNIDI
ncbi:MAG: VIT1/CCC1 transporter family protein [Candidatus Heimdallarchaeota archaeon]|nr:MAG: VIT1/CCC1 transporter family protein [Candidatus Heimdallarchaeota archaeon]